MTTNEKTPLGFVSADRRKKNVALVIGTALSLGVGALGVAGVVSLVSPAAAQASTDVMQRSLISHGVTVDDEVALRIKQSCNKNVSVLTVDFIGTYEGSKQLLTVQCDAKSDGISDIVVKYGNK